MRSTLRVQLVYILNHLHLNMILGVIYVLRNERALIDRAHSSMRAPEDCCPVGRCPYRQYGITRQLIGIPGSQTEHVLRASAVPGIPILSYTHTHIPRCRCLFHIPTNICIQPENVPRNMILATRPMRWITKRFNNSYISKIKITDKIIIHILK